MKALTHKQRVKINASLATIHAHGHDASAITRLAKTYEASGHSIRKGYELALNRFADANPDIGHALGNITRLVEASDAATVGKYDQALNQYIQTGDESGIDALAPMIAQDSIALAVRNGEISEADIANGGLEVALGFTPSDTMTAAANAPAPPVQAAPAGQVSTSPSRFDGSQYISTVGVTGIRAPKTGEALARWQGTPLAYTGPAVHVGEVG